MDCIRLPQSGQIGSSTSLAGTHIRYADIAQMDDAARAAVFEPDDNTARQTMRVRPD
jgi:hypothetical protein